MSEATPPPPAVSNSVNSDPVKIISGGYLHNSKGFAKGTKGGPGNPFVRRIAALRQAVAAAITPDDMQKIMEVLLNRGLAGDVAAIRELLDRTIGKPQEADLHQKIYELETLVGKLLSERDDWKNVHAQWQADRARDLDDQEVAFKERTTSAA